MVAPYIKKIEFKNGKSVHLESGTVLVAVGPNNSGKTKFLNQIRAHLYGGSVSGQNTNDGLINRIQLEWQGSEKEVSAALIESARRNWQERNGYFDPDLPRNYETRTFSYREEDIRQIAKRKDTLGAFVETLARWDEPHSRVEESKQQSLQQSRAAAVSLARNDNELDQVSRLFHEIFEEHLSVHDLRDGFVGFVLGEGPEDPSGATRGLSQETRDFMNQAPKLWFQGSGLRNAFGLLARIVSDERSIVIMDEPEAFLHPHQSWKLGMVLGRLCVMESKQIFCATHDRHLLTGLAQGAQDKLQVCRFSSSRGSNTKNYKVESVPSAFWEDIRHQSRVRFSEVLESFFYDEVILVEGEEDALFYQEAMEHYFQENDVPASRRGERMFLPTGGNSEFAPMVRLVDSLGPRVVAIGDVDLISDRDRFYETVKAFKTSNIAKKLTIIRDEIECIYKNDENLGETNTERAQRLLKERLDQKDPGVVDGEIRDLLEQIFDGLEQKQHMNRKNRLQRRIAKNANTRSSNLMVGTKVEGLVEQLHSVGLFLVPMGALEHFDESLLQKNGKRGWVRRALDKGVHRTSVVQDFIADVINN
ncbi:AAA family ATPase [Corynebacterium hadale]|uniref:ATP-dependent nuclease n=1 Tax=Corynebacterium hadale TaxID=2026255 RepID=UPI001EF2D2CF|nr:AAA family ATPase [Corynebacterium hadale]MCG7255164.1 AAA family ATPase [Corynebacterium hadale]MCG7256433.1 AAA family ATPase [Corynebacterium hadale]MCG7265558.1 AAA family ATPase [Corynebacterium hadale]